MQPFIGHEEKRLVFADGTAESCAKLVAIETGRGSAGAGHGYRGAIGQIEKILGVKIPIAQEFKQAAVELVGTALQDNVDLRAAAAPEFRRIVARLHLEFLDGVD